MYVYKGKYIGAKQLSGRVVLILCFKDLGLRIKAIHVLSQEYLKPSIFFNNHNSIIQFTLSYLG